MRIRFAVVSRILKNDRAAVRAVKTIQQFVLFIIYNIICYIIFIIYYSSDPPSSLINESICLVGKGRLKERCGLEPRTNFFRLRNRQKLVRIRFENIRYIWTHSQECFTNKKPRHKCLKWFTNNTVSKQWLLIQTNTLRLFYDPLSNVKRSAQSGASISVLLASVNWRACYVVLTDWKEIASVTLYTSE